MKTIWLFLILCLAFLVSGVKAQKSDEKSAKETVNRNVPPVCGGGVLNRKAISLPKPEYTKAAKAAKATGYVTVQVRIDEEGNVVEAKACSGHLLLRVASVEAARKAKIKPTFLSRRAVKVSGIIVYNFAGENLIDEVFTIPCEAPKMGNGFILNNRALNLVKPEYPQELKEDKISGAVNVQVIIDERGEVVSASAVSGHTELRKYAVEAVKKSRFKRTVLCGKPVKVTGIIVYNFIPPEK